MSIFFGKKRTRQQIQALVRCKQPDCVELLALFQAMLDETKTSLIVADDSVRIHRLQGRAEVLSDFLESVARSQEVLGLVDKRPT